MDWWRTKDTQPVSGFVVRGCGRRVLGRCLKAALEKSMKEGPTGATRTLRNIDAMNRLSLRYLEPEGSDL